MFEGSAHLQLSVNYKKTSSLVDVIQDAGSIGKQWTCKLSNYL